MIDWGRVAEPQTDRYDTEVALQMVTGRVSPQHPTPYQRRPVNYSPTIFDGEVAVRYIGPQPPCYPRYTHAPLRHRHITQAVELVRRWPAAFRQFQALMDSFHPMLDANIQLSAWGIATGSSSHSDEDKFGTLYGTIHDPMGLAEAFVHEMAHNKLRALGVYFESARHLILNPSTQLFESPIRKDCMRPMTAVFHAQYSFIYVTALDLYIIEAEEDPAQQYRYLGYLKHNVPRMELGHEEITRHINFDTAGKRFLEGFFSWSSRVLARGNDLLNAHGMSKTAIERSFRPAKTQK